MKEVTTPTCEVENARQNLPFGPHVDRDGHPRLTYWASDVNPLITHLYDEIARLETVAQSREGVCPDCVEILTATVLAAVDHEDELRRAFLAGYLASHGVAGLMSDDLTSERDGWEAWKGMYDARQQRQGPLGDLVGALLRRHVDQNAEETDAINRLQLADEAK